MDTLLHAIKRYVDDYGWSWSITRRLVNRMFGTNYTDSELEAIYEKGK